MSNFTGGTIQKVFPHHNPDEGRNIWNKNFEIVEDAIHFSITGSTSASTQVQGSNNITVVDSGITIPIVYTVLLDDDITTNSISSTTMSANSYYLGSTLINFGSQSSSDLVNVSAIGTGAYIGIGTPNITGYSIETIYLTEFQSGNTITDVTIDVDGVGSLPIQKYDFNQSGFTTLDIGDITPSVIYYLVYDGSVMQFFESNPNSDPGTYTNPSQVPIAIGGVEAGTIFNNVSYSDVFDDLFYPFLNSVFTSFGISGQNAILEKGNSVAGGPRTFTWSTSNSSLVQANSIIIKDITGGNVIISTPSTSILSTGIPNDGNESISISSVSKLSTNIQETHTWQIIGRRLNGAFFKRNFNVNWRWRIYWGTNSGITLTASEITGLTSNILDTTIIPQTFSYVGGDYKYLAIPATFSSPSLFKDGNTNLSIAMADVTEGYTAGTGTYKYLEMPITNQHGATNTYRLYRTRNILGGSINIITS